MVAGRETTSAIEEEGVQVCHTTESLRVCLKGRHYGHKALEAAPHFSHLHGTFMRIPRSHTIVAQSAHPDSVPYDASLRTASPLKRHENAEIIVLKA